jgi:hypothetical protein
VDRAFIGLAERQLLVAGVALLGVLAARAYQVTREGSVPLPVRPGLIRRVAGALPRDVASESP